MMTGFRRLSSLLAALLVGTSAASAGSLYDWSGLYVGATAGYGMGEYDQYAAGYPGTPGIFGRDMKGLVGGATVGYNYQSNQFVFGLEADFQASGIGGTAGTVPGWTCNTASCVNDVDWFATLRGRLGYAFDGYLPFVTGGLAYANVKSRDGNPSVPGVTDLDENVFGYAIGAGIEKALSENVTAKIEALYVDLSKAEVRRSNYTFTSDDQFAVVRVGLNWKF